MILNANRERQLFRLAFNKASFRRDQFQRCQNAFVGRLLAICAILCMSWSKRSNLTHVIFFHCVPRGVADTTCTSRLPQVFALHKIFQLPLWNNFRGLERIM